MMKFIENNKKIAISVTSIFILVIVLVILLLTNSSFINESGPDEIRKIEVQKNGSDGKVIVYNDGRVEYHRDGEIFNELWAKGKIDAFFSYYESGYSSEASVNDGAASFSYDEDELLDTIIGGGPGGSGGSGGNDDGEDIDDLFSTPTPNPSGGSSGSGSNPTPTPSNPQGQPWCLYWRLSYCVILYTPPPTGTPGPEEGILPADCQENLLTGKTVIGNELCVPTPSP